MPSPTMSLSGTSWLARDAADPPSTRRRRAASGWRPSAPARVIAGQVVVFAVAVAARLTVIVRHGGLHGNFGYDAGVYFAASDAFLHGRMPYRDFVLIHPPGVLLVLSPFASLTRVLSDDAAFTVTVLAFTLLGGVNAVLVLRVGRRLGLGTGGAVAAGLFYALWFGAVASEYLIKLEPIGNLFFLLGLLALLRCRGDGPLRWPAVAGCALGATMTVKIWWVVPFAITVLWLARRTRSWPQVRTFLAGAVLANLAIDGPFLLASPRAMWTSVVSDQLERKPFARSPLIRFTDLSTVPRLTGPLSGTSAAAVSLALVLVVGWLAQRAWRTRPVRPAVVLLFVQGAVLLWSPSWFPYYADFLAIPAALTVGAAAVGEPDRSRRTVPSGWLVVATVTAITVPALVMGRAAVSPWPGGAALARATSHVRCVMTDSPMGQIEVDALSRSLSDGCRNWVDVTGRTYGPDRSRAPRVGNLRWQRDLTAYLRSGRAVLIVRGQGTGLSASTRLAVTRDGVLARAGGQTVYRVRHDAPRRTLAG